MDFKKLFDDFSFCLEKRKGFLTEDNIRYIFFAKMYDQDSKLENYYLELPYSSQKNNPLFESDFSSLIVTKNGLHKKLDLFYKDQNCNVAIEIKFHRPSETTTGLPNKAGEIFNDIKRLQLICSENFKKYFVYVTDDEMNDYFINSKGITNPSLNNYLKSFYNSKTSQLIDNFHLKNANSIWRDGSKTFFDCASRSFRNTFDFSTISTKLKTIYSSDFVCSSISINQGKNGNLHIRVIEVL